MYVHRKIKLPSVKLIDSRESSIKIDCAQRSFIHFPKVGFSNLYCSSFDQEVIEAKSSASTALKLLALSNDM